MRKFLLAACSGLALAGCGDKTETAQTVDVSAVLPILEDQTETDAQETLDQLARRYVHLALALGELDPAYVDAYTGPEEWREEAAGSGKSLDELYDEAVLLMAELMVLPAPEGEDDRLDALEKTVQAMMARIRLLRGEELSFNDETALIYDAVPAGYDQAQFDAALEALDAAVPGDGPLGERIKAFEDTLVVPEENIEPVMQAAIAECRARTKAHYDLPADEKFDLEFVTGKPWSGYNWYQGDYHSLIQVNLDQPFRISRALDLGCHEGYPGHHVANIYIDKVRLKENGWEEYYVYPLFAPSAFFMEGSANYGLHLAFPDDEKIAFEQQTLYPLAGLDPALAETARQISAAREPLAQVTIWIARQYLDGEISRDQAEALSMKYNVSTPERAAQSLDFIETYRGYIINYSLGEDMVAKYVEAKAETPEERWAVFEDLLRRPVSASDIEVE